VHVNLDKFDVRASHSQFARHQLRMASAARLVPSGYNPASAFVPSKLADAISYEWDRNQAHASV
jgi:hypothetical protein